MTIQDGFAKFEWMQCMKIKFPFGLFPCQAASLKACDEAGIKLKSKLEDPLLSGLFHAAPVCPHQFNIFYFPILIPSS